MRMFTDYMFLLYVLYRHKLGYPSQMGFTAFIKDHLLQELTAEQTTFLLWFNK